ERRAVAAQAAAAGVGGVLQESERNGLPVPVREGPRKSTPSSPLRSSPWSPWAPVAHAQETPRMGGVLKVASIGEPATLDIQATTTTLTYEIRWHVYEPLFTHDRAWNPIPHLADGDVVSDRGLRHTITLRRGVKFHNGKEMTSADVVASLKR